MICKKPLLGYLGMPEDLAPIGKTVPKRKMLDRVLKEMDALKKVVEASDKQFFYVENFVYAAPVHLHATASIRSLLCSGLKG